MLQIVRLAALTLGFSILGYAAVAASFVRGPDPSGFGYAEDQRWRFIGVVLGATTGVLVESMVRLKQRGWKFTIRELIAAMTIAAFAVTVIGWLAHWGASPL